MLDRRSGNFIRFTRTAGGATIAPEEHITPELAHDAAGVDWDNAVEECELLSADGGDYDQEAFLRGDATPVLFTSAALNFGVNQLLDTLVRIAPARPVSSTPTATCGRSIPVQRVRVQGPGRHGLGASRPDRLRPGLFGHLRARRCAHPRRDRETVRHQVRAIGVRPTALDAGQRVAR